MKYTQKYLTKKPKNLSDEYNPRFIFSIQTNPKESKYMFITKSEEEMTAWMKEIMETIKNNNESINNEQKNSSNIEILYECVGKNNHEEIHRLLSKTPSLINTALNDRMDIRVLHLASCNEKMDFQTLNILLNFKADPNLKTNSFYISDQIEKQLPYTYTHLSKTRFSFRENSKKIKTPFQLVCENRSITKRILELFISNNSKALLIDWLNYDSISYLCMNSSATNEMINYLLDHLESDDTQKSNALDIYISREDASTSIIDRLIQKGFKFHSSPSNCNPKIAQFIFSKNLFDINRVLKGYSMLQSALINDPIDPIYICFLLKNGANPTIKSLSLLHKGDDSFSIACKNQSITAEILIHLFRSQNSSNSNANVRKKKKKIHFF